MEIPLPTASEPINCNIKVPGLRSMSYRALLLATLADGVSEISSLCIDAGIKDFISALNKLGIVAQLDENNCSCIIAGCNGKFPKRQAALWCGNAYVNLRFLITAVAATSGVYYIDGESKLRSLKISRLLNILCRQGVQLIPSESRKIPLTLIGADTLEGGEILFDKHIQSQLVSALLMIAPFARSPFSFTLLDLAHHSSIELTSSMMSEFGVLVHRIHHGQFMVPVPQRYQANDYSVEPDFAYAIYFFAAAALTGGQVTMRAVNRNMIKQKNVRFLTILEKMGCQVIETTSGLTVQGANTLQGIEVSLRNISDAFLAVMVLAVFAKSPSRISHLRSTRKNERERLAAMKDEFKKCGIRMEMGKDWVEIYPSKPKAVTLTSHQDHHIAMALALLGVKTPTMKLDDRSDLNERYPNFWNAWTSLLKSHASLVS